MNLAVLAQQSLWEAGTDVSVVSMPSFELFEQQSEEYKETVLPSAVTKRLSIEMASTFGWERYIGREGKALGINRFGASGPADRVIQEYGFTVENIVKLYNSLP
ncbi:Transketolase [compost metagenome]